MYPQKCGVVWLALVLEVNRSPMVLAASLHVVACHRRFGMHDALNSPMRTAVATATPYPPQNLEQAEGRHQGRAQNSGFLGIPN